MQRSLDLGLFIVDVQHGKMALMPNENSKSPDQLTFSLIRAICSLILKVDIEEPIAPDTALFFFLRPKNISPQKHMLWYSFEVPHTFLWRKKKI